MPKWLAAPLSNILTSNPELLKEGATQLKAYADKHPEQVKQILGKFIKTGSKAPTPDQATMQGL